MRGKRYDSPNMSDTTLLVTVEDLINMAMGAQDVNVVNFKMVQTVLHILARQLRMLETQVEIRVSEAPPAKGKKEKKKPEPSSESSSSRSARKISPPPKHMKEIKEEKAKPKEKEKAEQAVLKEKEKESKIAAKEKDKADKAGSRDREKTERGVSKEREKAERAQAKERDKADRDESKEKEKAERAQSKERDKTDRAESKEKEKTERTQSKERDKADRAESKEREKAERAQSKERDKADKAESKEKEKAERAQSKERDKADKAESKEKEKAERAQSKERDKADKADSKEKEKAERAQSKERDKADRAGSKERDKAERAELEAKEKAERAESRQREKGDKRAIKKREEEERAESKEREKAEKRAVKVKEKAERDESRQRAKGEKDKEKAERAESKEREKAEKSAVKDKEKIEKMDAKDRAKAEKERENIEKMDAKDKEKAEKEKEKADKAAAKEREKLDKMSAKEREKYEKEATKELEKAGKARAKEDKAKLTQQDNTASGTGIAIKEVERHKEKVLIVEKGPTTRTDSRTRVGSIEVVTLSQFELLEAAVKDLKEKAGPLPFPALPDNEKLRSELAKGSASLTDTMQAMQVAARVQAAEAAIARMAGLLTQLAAAGALPQDVAGKLEDVKAEMDAITEESMKRPSAAPARKSVAIDPMSKKESTTPKADGRPSSAATRPSITSRTSAASRISSVGAAAGVTHIEMDDALRSLKDDLTKNVNSLTAKATTAAEMASATAKAVADKLDIALKLNTRINTLYSLVTDYADQLSGFDAGLTTQMQSFQEQMAQMRNDLKGGLTQLEQANNNSETAAVMELTERYEGLVTALDVTLHAHQTLTAFQKQLGDELRSLLECVEMLREQKADRDEVQDGLRDKADNSRLAGLLTEAEFALSRAGLERRLDLCYDKFRKQEQVWMGAVKELTLVTEGKAEIMQLLAARGDAQQQFRDIQDKLNKLAVILGEPKAAMITRQLSRGGRCGACQLPALQEPVDISFGKPPPLPAVRPPPTGEEKPCLPEWRPIQPPDEREHTCHRWVGGSHTLLADSVVREQAAPLQTQLPPTNTYMGYGSDGRLYMMETALEPCAECNLLSPDKPPAEHPHAHAHAHAHADGAGDCTRPEPDTNGAEPINTNE